MDLEDGRLFIRHLSYFVRTHEKALANSIHLRPQTRHEGSQSTSSINTTTQIRPLLQQSNSSSSVATTTNNGLFSFNFGSSHAKPAKLYLTPNQLYYLLSRFEELSVVIGPMNVRLENIDSDSTPMNYVSFLTQTTRPRYRNADQESLHSVSSVRSVVSTMTTLWSSLGLSSNAEQKEEKRRAAEMEDLRYLYSAFTKIPALKMVLDHRIRRIKDYEEFPFDTAVPMWVFKNLSVLEVIDLDFRSFYGWDRLAEQLRSLTVKRAGIDDVEDLLTNIVLDDADKRRRRSNKSPISPVMAFSSPSPAQRKAELARKGSASEAIDVPRTSSEASAEQESRPSTQTGHGTPSRTSSGRKGLARHNLQRRSSSSGSSNPRHTPRTSSISLVPAHFSLKWRFLRHLCIADNGLTTLSTHSLIPINQTLQSLDASANLFSEIPESLSTITSLRALNLSGCMITSLNSLTRQPLPAITVLNVRGNRLETIAGIDKLYSLERLDLRDNRLTDPIELARLSGMPNFREVWVAKNPFTRTFTNYRIQIFNLFRKVAGFTEDILIDGTGPTYTEKKYLIDRVPEPIIPVIRPSFDDEVARQPAPETPDANTPGDAKSRRKSAKRRVVDLSQESPKSKTPTTPKTLPRPRETTQTWDDDKRSTSPIQSSTDDEPVTPADFSESGEQYRQRIEALKADFDKPWNATSPTPHEPNPFYSASVSASAGPVAH